MFLRISPSPEVFEDIEPLASTKPAVPLGDRWCIKCSTQAKLALFFGGAPNFHLASSCKSSPLQSLSLKGGLAKTKSAFKSLNWSSRKESPHSIFASIPLMAAFILHNRHVVWLLS